MDESLNVIFAGTPDFSVPTLQALIDSKHNICAVYTQPDRPSGRGRKITFSPIKSLALKHNITVHQPKNFRDDTEMAQFLNYQASVMVVVAYGIILPKKVLDAPEFGCVNIHASLLPRWRGAAPIQRAIQNSDKSTGITIMQMDEHLDTGDILYHVACRINPSETSTALHDRLSQLGAKTIVNSIEKLSRDELAKVPQDESIACYAKKITKQEAAISWSLSAQQICAKICAFHSWPVCHTFYQHQQLRILHADHIERNVDAAAGEVIDVNKDGIDICAGDGQIVRLIYVQLAGKKVIAVADFLHAHKIQIGDIFEDL